MKKQFNFQLRQQNDRRDWENIEVYYKTHCDRETAVHYARQISKTFKSEVRMTEGAEPLKASGTYINAYS